MSKQNLKANRFAVYTKGMAPKPPDRAEFGARVGELMTKKNLSIIDLSKAIEVSYEMARRYATGGGKPNWDRMRKIAKFLDVDPYWLAYGDVEGEKPIERTPLQVFKITDKDIDSELDGFERISVPIVADLAVQIDNPMGCAFKSNSILLVKLSSGVIAGRNHLIKAIDENAYVTHLVRRVKFNQSMQPIFITEDSDYPELGTDTFLPIGEVVAQLSTC